MQYSLSVMLLVAILLSSFANADNEVRDIDLRGLVFASFEGKSIYRGRVISDIDHFDFGANISFYGFSAGLKRIDEEQYDLTAYFFAYSYNFNLLNLSVGIQKDDPILKEDEAFIEAVFPTDKYFETKFSFFQGIDDRSSKYLELQLSHPWKSANGYWTAKPYALVSAGDYYSDSFTFNHFEIGSDITYRITEHFYLSAYGAVVSPLDNVKDAGFESDTKVNGGLILRYTF